MQPLEQWFIDRDARRNRASALRTWTRDNRLEPLIDGASYFARLAAALEATEEGDEVYFTDFRGDVGERLTDALTVGEALRGCAKRGVKVFGLIWRSHPSWLEGGEGENAELAREICDAGGQVLLDARTRRAGSHHQKFVVIRHRDRPQDDVAFAGGIDLGEGRRDDSRHLGDANPTALPTPYGARPPWHDAQVQLQGPAVTDVELTFRERWEGSTALDLPSPFRMLMDRAYHAGKLVGRDLPPPRADPPAAGAHAVQVLRTYPARWRRYPFAPLGERGIEAAYRRTFARARRLIYIEDQYLWAPVVAKVLAAALRADPDLYVIAVVPRYPDREGVARWPSLVGREEAIRLCHAAAAERFAIYDLENEAGTPIYVHAKVVVVDDVWAMIGSDNLNRRSWTHDSELSCSVLDEDRDSREPTDPAGLGDGARRFARDLRLQLWREHLGRPEDDPAADLLDPAEAFEALRASAERLQAWHDGGKVGERPHGRLRPHQPERLPRWRRAVAVGPYRWLYDPDGRALRHRLRRR